MALIPRINTALLIQPSVPGLAPKVEPAGLWSGAAPGSGPQSALRLVSRLVSRPVARVVATLRVAALRVATWVRNAADSLGLGSCDLGSSLVSPAQLGHLVQLLARRTYTPSEVRLIYSQLGEP